MGLEDWMKLQVRIQLYCGLEGDLRLTKDLRLTVDLRMAIHEWLTVYSSINFDELLLDVYLRIPHINVDLIIGLEVLKSFDNVNL